MTTNPSDTQSSTIHFQPPSARKISLAEARERFPGHGSTCHVIEGLDCDCTEGRLRAQNAALVEALRATPCTRSGLPCSQAMSPDRCQRCAAIAQAEEQA